MSDQGYVGGIDLNLSASGDLNNAQFRFVTWSSGGARKVVQATGGSNPVPLGILQNDPKDGEAALVRIAGESKLKCALAASSITYGAFLVSGSEGFGYPQGATSSSAAANAIVLGPNVTTAGASNVIVSVMLLGPAGIKVAAS